MPQDIREKIDAARKKREDAGARHRTAQEAVFAEENRLDDAFKDKHGIESHMTTKSGPMMASQNRWVDDAIRRSILDAVNDDSVDFLAFPKDEQAIGKVGGTDYPKDGTIDFYNRDVQNRLRGIVKKIDKDARIQEIGLESPMRREGEFPAYGLRITPEFRRRVKEQGLPTFAAFGAATLSHLALLGTRCQLHALLRAPALLQISCPTWLVGCALGLRPDHMSVASAWHLSLFAVRPTVFQRHTAR